MVKKRGYRTVVVPGTKSEIRVFCSARVADALAQLTPGLSLYEGVKLWQVLEAVYAQGRKDGAREAFTELDRRYDEVKRLVPHRLPGRPRTRK